MHQPTKLGRYTVGTLLFVTLLVTAALCGHAWVAQAATQAGPAALVATATAPPAFAPVAPPVTTAPPTISAERAWALIEADLAHSPWLDDADEFGAWVDSTGNRCQRVTEEVALRLRGLDVLLNEHWIGRHATKLLLSGLGVTAMVVPEPGVGLSAGAFALVVKASPAWTEALACQAEDLGGWIESATEHWEQYALAHQRVSNHPTAEHLEAWVQSAQALLPYLEKGELVFAALNDYAANVDGHLSDLSDYLKGVDHWTVAWLADELNDRVIGTVAGWMDELRPTLLKTQGRLMVDQALIATLPMRFERFEIVDEHSVP